MERQCFSSKIRNEVGCPHLALLFNIVLEVLASAVRHEKEIKDIHTIKEEIKLFLFSYDIIVNIEKSQEVYKKYPRPNK